MPKTLEIFVILLLAIIASFSVSSSSDSAQDSESEEYQNLRDDFDEGNDDFTATFLYDVIDDNPDDSIITSPFSVLFLLSQLALYAKGTSYEELANLLNLRSRRDIRTMIPKYLDDINSQQNVEISLAEKVYGSINYPFSKAFKRDTRQIFHAKAQNLDFSDSQESADTINSWVASKTNNLIKDLISPSSLGEDTRLVLTNAIYFKGNWRRPFSPERTTEQYFHVTHRKKVSVKMMNQIAYFNYGYLDNIRAKVIQLFYKSGNFSFVSVLPNKNHSISSLAKTLQDLDLQTDVISNLDSARVNLSLPVIHTETTTDLKDVLQRNGVTSIFDYNNSDLSGILKYPEPLYVSSAIQKAKIIVNESGSEAAAANAAVVGTRAAPLIKSLQMFNANRPFLYYILFENAPIFAGLYAGPQ